MKVHVVQVLATLNFSQQTKQKRAVGAALSSVDVESGDCGVCARRTRRCAATYGINYTSIAGISVGAGAVNVNRCKAGQSRSASAGKGHCAVVIVKGDKE